MRTAWPTARAVFTRLELLERARWMRRPRVVPCLAEVTQQIHSFRASGVSSFQAARVVASEPMASRKSNGLLCMKPALLALLVISFSRCYGPAEAGCHSSILLPSGSSSHAKRPFASSSRFRIATPFALSRARNASMSSTA